MAKGYMQEIRERILSAEEGSVFSTSDFADIADTNTVRSALYRLIQDGILRRILNGVYEKPKYSKLLDEYVAADPEADISEIESVYEEAAEALLEGNLRQYTDLNRAFHSEIWTAAGNQKMKNMISELWNGLSMGSMVSEEDYAKVSIKEHGKILKAIQKHDKEAAQKAMYDHIMRSRDDMLTYYK